jgi:DNA topoisomerase-3
MERSGKWLVLTEKPSVAADVTKALGGFEKVGEYYESGTHVVTWAVGHILELLAPEDIDPKYKRWLIQDLPIIPKKFEYKPKAGQEKRLEVIRELANRKDVVGMVNACDAGREGELIFREIFDHCAANKPHMRLWLQSMTMDSIRKEFKRLREGRDYDHLGDAARCRSESDWLIGMNVTRAMTRRLATRTRRGEAWSIGRVQTPTLKLIVDREMEVLAHRPEPFWTVEGRFSTPTHDYAGQWFNPDFKRASSVDDEDSVSTRDRDDRIFSKSELDAVLVDIEGNRTKAKATEVRKESREIAPQLFDLTTLQREANRRFGMSASRTLQAAQRLYERYKLLTYPRTDARYLPEDYEEVCQDTLRKFSNSGIDKARVCGEILKRGMLNKDRIFNSKEISDHFAIIPTGEIPGALEGDDARIFELVLKRFLAAFMPHAVWAKVERVTRLGRQSFRTRVSDLQEPGWRGVYGVDTEEESSLPRLDATGLTALPDGSTPVSTVEFTPTEALTRPPARVTEAKLLSMMEHCGRVLEDEEIAEALREKGIGTPATRAEIIENLVGKEYVIRVGRALKPTVKGIRLVDIVSRIPVDMLGSVELTGEMEFELKMMEKGEKSRAQFMKEMVGFTSEMVEKTRGFDYNGLYEKDSVLGDCPACKQGKVVETFWNYRCNQDKKCEFMVWKEKNHRYIDRTLMRDVLTGRKIGPLEFFSNGGTGYSAFMGVTEKGVMLFDEAGNPMEAAPGSENKVLAEYPIEATYLGYSGKIIETETTYVCEFDTTNRVNPVAAAETPAAAGASVAEGSGVPSADGGKNGEVPKKGKGGKGKSKESSKASKTKIRKLISRMPKTLCGHPVTLDEFRFYLVTGATPEILDFKSKKGRPFGASLHMKQDGSFEFKFVSRKKALAEANGESADKPKKPRGTKAKVVKKDAAAAVGDGTPSKAPKSVKAPKTSKTSKAPKSSKPSKTAAPLS